MHYYKWNNLIGGLIFSPAKAGQPVLLNLTKEQITQAAVETGHFESDEDTWDSFTRKVRMLCRNKDIVGTANEFAMDKNGIYRETQNGESFQTHFPRLLSLLVISVIPLTEDSEVDYTAANYYDRTDSFLSLNGLPSIPKQNKILNWNRAWQRLEDWSVGYKGGRLGIFKACNFNSQAHTYVGKPFSQCLIPASTIRDLPRAFVRAGWVPQQALSPAEWHSLLKAHCYDLGFRQAALRTIQADDSLREYVITILQDRFNRWDGTINTAAKPTSLHKTGNRHSKEVRQQKDTTFARFYLSFADLEQTGYVFQWQYRIKAAQPLPDTLQVLGHLLEAQPGNWSSAVAMQFQEGLAGNDELNNWTIKWPNTDIRLFQSGQWSGLSSRIWIEADELSRHALMFAVCKPSHIDRMRQWGRSFQMGDFQEYRPDHDFDATGWPAGYGLFRFRRPTQGIPNTPYTLPVGQHLEWVGGLRTGYHEYLSLTRPHLRVVGGDGSVLPVAFTENGQQIPLTAHPDDPTRFLLTGDVPANVPIECRLEGQPLRLAASFVGADATNPETGWSELPHRDEFGNSNDAAGTNTVFQGLTTQGLLENRLRFMQFQKHIFFPGTNAGACPYEPGQADWSVGDTLLTYLTARRECGVDSFLTAYETILTEATQQQKLPLLGNVGRARRWALGWYDTLGYVDYDYDSGCIRVVPPTLLPVPCTSGHRAILVGGRSPELLMRLRAAAREAGVTVCVRHQADGQYLAPSVVSLYCDAPFHDKTTSPIQWVARQLSIPYMAEELPAWRMLERSGSIAEYRATLRPESEADVGTWRLRVFNPDRLCFEPATGPLDTSFTLTERQFNAYEKVYYLWINGQSHRVDKNWGRYMVLQQRGRQVIYRRTQHNQLAIPATLPLPRVLGRGFALLSGHIPAKARLNLDGTPRDYLLYENADNILANNYVPKLGQQIQATNQ